MKKLVVHIGTPKTGTSSLQGYLSTNHLEVLEQSSVLYPSNDGGTGFGINRISNGALLQPEYYDDVALRTKFDNWFAKADVVFLSEEVLFLDDNLKMLQYLKNDKVEIVIMGFFRNAAEYLSSLWMEFNRFENRRLAPSLCEFMKGTAYLRSLGNLISLIDKRPEYTFILLPYKPKGSAENSVGKAFNILGVDVGGGQVETHNESMSRVEADIRQLALREGWAVCDSINSHDIKKIANELSSGDNRPVIHTITDQVIESVCDEHSHFLDHILKMTGAQDSIFKELRPACFGTERDSYSPIHVSEYRKIQSMLSDLAHPG